MLPTCKNQRPRGAFEYSANSPSFSLNSLFSVLFYLLFSMAGAEFSHIFCFQRACGRRGPRLVCVCVCVCLNCVCFAVSLRSAGPPNAALLPVCHYFSRFFPRALPPPEWRRAQARTALLYTAARSSIHLPLRCAVMISPPNRQGAVQMSDVIRRSMLSETDCCFANRDTLAIHESPPGKEHAKQRAPKN